jgi:hypothetical protein
MSALRRFFELSASSLVQPLRTELGQWSNEGDQKPSRRSWCAWTTFSRLGRDAGYWTAELPLLSEIGERSVVDGGTWGQPFPYEDLAHIIVPRRFTEEYAAPKRFAHWTHEQDINGLSGRLNGEGIEHRLAEHVLEIKLF